jgi:hypothetical protein
MKEVYMEANIVISADRASECTQGCFYIRDPLPSSVFGISRLGMVHAQVLCPSDEVAEAATLFATEPLSQRACTLQERVLAKRVLHRSTKQMYFECAEGLQRESGHRRKGRFGDLNELQRTSSDAGDALCSWETLVTSVSKRRLSIPTDRPATMAGLASTIGTRIGGEYAAGLGSNFPIEGLEWVSRPSRRLESGGPSWSWASHGRPSLYFQRNTETMAKAESSSVRLKNEHNPFGEVSEAWIHLLGPMVRF